jgi:hypothetical protein
MVADIIAKLCVFVLQGPRIFVEQFYAPETKWQGGIIVLRGQNASEAEVLFVPIPCSPRSFALKFSRRDRKSSICYSIVRSRLDQHGTLSGKVTLLHAKFLLSYSNGPLT